MQETKRRSRFGLAPLAVAVAMAVALAGSLTIFAQDPGNDCPDCFLDATDFSGKDLAGVILTGASLYRANFELADLSGADLTGANLNKANMTGANLNGAQLIGADLTGAIGLQLADTTDVQTDASTTCPDGAAGPCDFSVGS